MSIKKPNSGGVYNPRRGGSKGNTLLAQRGRRGLIAGGEMMPDKLNKEQTSAEKKTIKFYLDYICNMNSEHNYNTIITTLHIYSLQFFL